MIAVFAAIVLFVCTKYGLEFYANNQQLTEAGVSHSPNVLDPQAEKSKLTTALAADLSEINTKDGSGSEGGVRWNYSGSEGPTHWQILNPDFEACGEAKQNTASPVDIVSPQIDDKLKPLRFALTPTTVLWRLLHGALTGSMHHAGNIEIEGDQFFPKTFYFHAPSEHWVNGVPYEAEFQILFQRSTGETAMLAVMVARSGAQASANRALKSLVSQLPENEDHEVSIDDFNLTSVLPRNHNYFYYMGSLTKPPCTRSIPWFVLTDAVAIDAGDLDLLQKLVGKGVRPLQRAVHLKVRRSAR